MEAKCTILCAPINAVGHMNATLGLALVLKKRGHRVVFATELSSQGRFVNHGFEEELYEVDSKIGVNETVESIYDHFRLPAVEQYPILAITTSFSIANGKYLHPRISEIVATVKPDIIIQDNLGCWPALFSAKIPVAVLCSTNPLQIMEHDGLPPYRTGLPLHGRQEEWLKYRKNREEAVSEAWKEYNQWVQSVGAPPLPALKFQYIPDGLSFYIYPRSLAALYLANHPNPQTFFGIDHVIRPTQVTFELPQKLLDLPGKLLLLTMGTLGSGDIQLMKRLVQILSKSKHKFIVSKGRKHQEFELAENMWGEEYLPQLAVLPLVDLAIIHGGNNSFVETLYFGKPMIVIPLFADQHDNYRMAIEANIGDGFNVFLDPEDDLLHKIERILNDDKVSENVRRISKELKESSALEEAALHIEKMALKGIETERS